MKKYLLPLLAAIGLGIAVVTVLVGNRGKSDVPTVVMTPQAPFDHFVAGSGILEASTQNIAVGTPVSGIVSALYVKWGDRVNAGDSLFKIDDRDLQARLLSSKAKAKEAETVLAGAQQHLEVAEKLGGIVSLEELNGKRNDVAIDRAALQVAKAQVEEVELEIRRRIIKAPITGRVLRINIRLGEFAASVGTGEPLLVLGNDDRLYIRVEVDEHDAWRIRPGAKAVAFLHGNPNVKIPAEFQRIEPQIIPKTLMTGRGTERSDVRVLQVIFGFDHGSWPVYVGQEMDVFIEAQPATTEAK